MTEENDAFSKNHISIKQLLGSRKDFLLFKILKVLAPKEINKENSLLCFITNIFLSFVAKSTNVFKAANAVKRNSCCSKG